MHRQTFQLGSSFVSRKFLLFFNGSLKEPPCPGARTIIPSLSREPRKALGRLTHCAPKKKCEAYIKVPCLLTSLPLSRSAFARNKCKRKKKIWSMPANFQLLVFFTRTMPSRTRVNRRRELKLIERS